MTENGTITDQQREGMLLCMLLAVTVSPEYRTEKVHEVMRILRDEPEFQGSGLSTDDLLAKVSEDLHRKPERILTSVVELLPDESHRRRGLELIAQIVCSAGVVSEDDAALLRRLNEAFGFSEQTLEEIALSVQRGLVQFMMVYLVYITATADGKEHPEEFEEMIPLLLSLPAFGGMGSKRFAYVAQSVRRHLEVMRDKWGLEYIAGTLRRASELLGDKSIPSQALKVVARGIFADGKIDAREQELFLTLAKLLGITTDTGHEMINQAVAESRDRLKKIQTTEAKLS